MESGTTINPGNEDSDYKLNVRKPKIMSFTSNGYDKSCYHRTVGNQNISKINSIISFPVPVG